MIEPSGSLKVAVKIIRQQASELAGRLRFGCSEDGSHTNGD